MNAQARGREVCASLYPHVGFITSMIALYMNVTQILPRLVSIAICEELRATVRYRAVSVFYFGVAKRWYMESRTSFG